MTHGWVVGCILNIKSSLQTGACGLYLEMEFAVMSLCRVYRTGTQVSVSKNGQVGEDRRVNTPGINSPPLQHQFKKAKMKKYVNGLNRSCRWYELQNGWMDSHVFLPTTILKQIKPTRQNEELGICNYNSWSQQH